MDKQSNLREITVGDIWRIFISHFWIIALSVVLVITGFYVFNKMTYEPLYKSTATMYILKQSTDGSTVEQKATEDFSLALNVVRDCDHMLKSHLVLNQVIDNLDLDIDYDDLVDCISTSNPEDTRILEVTVEAATPESAQRIVNEVCLIGELAIEEAMAFDQVNIFEEGVLNKSPSNRVTLMTYMLIAMIVTVFVYAVYLLRFLFDDRIKTDDEIERHLQLTVIGDIPNAFSGKGSKYGYKYSGKYRYNYGYGYGYGYGYSYGAKNNKNNDKKSADPIDKKFDTKKKNSKKDKEEA